MRQWIFDILGFFFPVYCPVCGDPMYVPKQVVCLKCELHMPKTNFSKDPDNPLAQLFWGKVPIEGITALFRFEKGSKYQNLLHLLKYQGEQKIGIYLGRLLASDILHTEFANIDYIVPIPLHKKKEKKRGYNQSKLIAEGLSEIIGIPLNTNIVYRVSNTDSQTRKGRWERWENMENVFTLCEEPNKLSGLKLLLIDDVITTGATLEACANVLQNINGIKLYIATAAYA